MWQAIDRKLRIAGVAMFTITVMLVIVSLWGADQGVTTWLRVTSLVVTIVEVIFVLIFNLFWAQIWAKVPLLQKLVFPDVSGHWEGEIRWHLKDGDEINEGSKQMKIEVVQKWLGFVVTYSSKTGESRSFNAWPEKDPDTKTYTLWYLYDFTPVEVERATNSSHKGAACLNFKIDDLNTCSGSYFTNRRTNGDIAIRRV